MDEKTNLVPIPGMLFNNCISEHHTATVKNVYGDGFVEFEGIPDKCPIHALTPIPLTESVIKELLGRMYYFYIDYYPRKDTVTDEIYEYEFHLDSHIFECSYVHELQAFVYGWGYDHRLNENG